MSKRIIVTSWNQKLSAYDGQTKVSMRVRLDKLDKYLPESKKIASHGCVNLYEDDAKALFEWAPIGAIVQVR